MTSSPNSGVEIPRTFGLTPKNSEKMVPSASKITWIPPPFQAPMTSWAFWPVMSGRPMLAKSPTTAARNDEVGTADQLAKPFLTWSTPTAFEKT